MRCLIRRRGADGSWGERSLEAPVVTIGRGTHCSVELPGTMVAIEHARLQLTAPGRYLLESEALAGVEVRGTSGVRSSEVRSGDFLRIVGHELEIQKPSAGYDLVLAVTPHLSDAQFTRAGAAVDLEGAGLGLRRAAWAGVLLVLGIGLAVPLAMRAAGARAPHLGLLSDAVWSPGPTSFAHAQFARDCGRCHEWFKPVAESVCRNCHTQTGDHSSAPAVQERLAAGGGCLACHREHKGPHGLVIRAPELCSDCHRKPVSFAQVTPPAPAADFAGVHPEFTPDTASSALVFAHAGHLRAEGVRGPDGVEKLSCGDCHAPTAGRVAYGMPSFEKDCQRCHRLEALVNGQPTELPHARNEAVWRLLSMSGAGPAPLASPPSGTGLLQRAGAAAPRGAGPVAGDTAPAMFEGLCGSCHLIEQDAAGAPRVRPPAIPAHGLGAAEFTHAPHAAVACGDCHAAASSTRADDVLMPKLETCRACHGGNDAAHGIPSSCVSCHRFHREPERTRLASPVRASP